jgi:hypothetical protein
MTEAPTTAEPPAGTFEHWWLEHDPREKYFDDWTTADVLQLCRLAYNAGGLDALDRVRRRQAMLDGSGAVSQ